MNKDNQNTDYYIGIKDIDIKKDLIFCDIYNPFKEASLIGKDDLRIKLSGIKKAKVLEQTYYPTPQKLLDDVSANTDLQNFLLL